MRAARTIDWLAGRWMAGAGFMAAALLAVAPMLAMLVPPAVPPVLLCSPAYMIHQVEEHRGDRFRRFVNARVLGGRTAMTTGDVLLVNLPLVWGLNLAASYLALFVSPWLGLIAGYAMLVNAAGHVGLAMRLRGYNPGVATAALLFVPLGAWVVVANRSAGAGEHLFAIGGALAIHLAITVAAVRRAGR